MTNFDLWKLINYIIGKDYYSNRISPDEFDLDLKSANVRLLRKRLGFPESYVPGTANAGADSSRLIQTDLRPFYMDEEVDVKDGIVTLDKWFYIEDFYLLGSRSSEIISRQEISSRLSDPQLVPTTKDAAAYIIKEGLRVYPNTVSKINIWYIRKPVDPSFKVNTGSGNQPVYDTSSVELEWDEGSKIDILFLILANLGINTERNEIVQQAENLIKTGS